MDNVIKSLFVILHLGLSVGAAAQHENHAGHHESFVGTLDSQPLLAQALRLEEALAFLGSALRPADSARLKALQHEKPGPMVVKAVQDILDPYVLAVADISPEARVKVRRGAAAAQLMQNGWTSFLVKVHNGAAVTAALNVESPNSAPTLHMTSIHNYTKGTADPVNAISDGQVANRFLQTEMYTSRPLNPTLSGLKLEYAVVQIYSKDAGQREVKIGFNVGAGSQDIGFRNTVDILFDIKPAVKVVLHVKDDDGSPTMASFTITDDIERLLNHSEDDYVHALTGLPPKYRELAARDEYGRPAKSLVGIYPLPSRRVATHDEYPDFFFHPQVYRQDGEHVILPPGTYDVAFTRGPEYIPQHQKLVVPEGVSSFDAPFHLKRWVHMASLGWYSSDHHIHSAGCSHYESPTYGVSPKHMWRQIVGEDLNVGNALTWGPGWYYQKQFFTGEVHPLSTDKNILRFDVEVSMFPSSHAGHLSLLNLKEDDYPGTEKMEDWPSWTLPVLKWAKEQGAATGYSHSGFGLEPIEATTDLPNYSTPKMDGNGANEYIVAVAHDLIDFYSAGDTPAPWELNMWYHSLNLGFTPRISGESDFPCVYDERVGIVRSYTYVDGKLDYAGFIKGLVKGHSYVTDGKSHIIDFKVGDAEMGVDDSTLHLSKSGKVQITARGVSLLADRQDKNGADIASRVLTEQPYWHVERARIGTSRQVPIELLVNGKVVDTIKMTADGKWNDLKFNYKIKHSSWVALRIYPSVHTNPIFVKIGGKPILSKRSAEWAVRAVDQAWKKKSPLIRKPEQHAAKEAYDKARDIYKKMMQDAEHD